MEVSLPEAAELLGVSPATLRNWKRKGMPVASNDDTGGRGRGTVVDVEAVRRWRYGDPLSVENELAGFAAFLADFMMYDSGHSEPPKAWADRGCMIPPHRLVGISQKQLAQTLLLIWRYRYVRLKKEAPEHWPAALRPILHRAKNKTRLVR